MTVKVLIVDDSAIMRNLMTEILSKEQDIEVVGVAADAFEAREKVKQLSPDVLTLDINMPGMDGLSFLANLMRLRPTPVIVVSNFSTSGSEALIEARNLGAVDVVTKSFDNGVNGVTAFAAELGSKITAAARSGDDRQSPLNVDDLLAADRAIDEVFPNKKIRVEPKSRSPVIVIGASTGGVEAISALISVLPDKLPPIFIAQHIPSGFSQSFAERLDKVGVMRVVEAEEGMEAEMGCAYVAPGGKHLLIKANGNKLRCEISLAAPINRHRPSVDILFRSAAAVSGARVLAILLTGMGSDGAQGMLDITNEGGVTLAQDRASSVVWGMPKAAHDLKAVDQLVSLGELPQQILSWRDKLGHTGGKR